MASIKDTPNISSITKVTRKELANLLNLSEVTITNYVKAGMAGVTGSGKTQRFNLSEAIAWIKEFEVQKALKSNRQPIDDDVATLEKRKLLAQVQKAEYEAAAMMEAMVLVDDAEKEINRHLERLRTKLLSIPAVWAPQLLGLKEIPDAVDSLRELTELMMIELAGDDIGDNDEADETLEETDEA